MKRRDVRSRNGPGMSLPAAGSMEAPAVNDDLSLNEQRQMLKLCSKCALVCFTILAFLLLLQAVTGGLLSIKVIADMPGGAEEAAERIADYATIRSLHATFGQLSLIPAFAVMAFSILFMLNISGVEARHTRISWAQVVKSIMLVVILVGLCIGGRLFALKLVEDRFWLLLEGEAHAKSAGITIDTFSSTGFYTFVVLHGVVLPVLAVIIMIFMWAPFNEFTAKKKKELKLSKWSKFSVVVETDESKPPEKAAEKAPDGKSVSDWIAMKRMVDSESNEEDKN